MADLIRVNVVLDTSELDALRTALADSPREFYAVVNNTILPQAQVKLDATLNKPGEPTGGKFTFSTPKSQRFVFANVQLPYRRTGNVLQWRVTLKAFTGQSIDLIFDNPVSYAPFVFGSPSQPQVIGMRGRYLNSQVELPKQTAVVLAQFSNAWVTVFKARESA